MAQAPLVTVLMPVYNGEEYLCEAIESILNQTFRNFEFVIINDGSIDGTVAILTDYQRRDERIQVWHQENQGLIAVLNKGLDLAQGRYIARMDADDISHPERLAIQVAYLDSNPEIGLVSTNFYLIDSVGEITGGPVLKSSLSNARVEWELYWGNPIVHPSVMFHAVIVRSCGGYPEGFQYYAEDYALWLHMLDETKVTVLEQPLLYLRKHERNVTAVNLRAHIDEVISVAQSALANRLGYEPSVRPIWLVRRLPIDGSVSAVELKQSIDLLLDAFRNLTTRHGSEKAHLRDIKMDLVRRLLWLVESYGYQSRVQPLMAFGHVFSLSPQLIVSSVGIRVLLKTLSGPRLVNIGRYVRHLFTWLKFRGERYQ